MSGKYAPSLRRTMLTLSKLIDEVKCYETVRMMRWPEGVCCIECGAKSVTQRGKHGHWSVSRI